MELVGDRFHESPIAEPLEVGGGPFLTGVALAEGALVLGFAVGREQEAADPWVPPQRRRRMAERTNDVKSCRDASAAGA
jgi:hypothetical protein